VLDTSPCGFQSSQKLDFHRYEHLNPVLLAMIRIENGLQPYTDTQIDPGLVRSVLLPEQPLGKDAHGETRIRPTGRSER
jgi:hypothetical protein